MVVHQVVDAEEIAGNGDELMGKKSKRKKKRKKDKNKK